MSDKTLPEPKLDLARPTTTLTRSSAMYIPESMRTNSPGGVKVAVIEFLEKNITEERTDELIDLLMAQIGGKLPWWIPGAIVRKILDALLPEVVVTALSKLILRL